MKNLRILAVFFLIYLFSCDNQLNEDNEICETMKVNDSCEVKLINDSLIEIAILSKNKIALKKTLISSTSNDIIEIKYFSNGFNFYNYHPLDKSFIFKSINNNQIDNIILPKFDFKKINYYELEVSITCINFPINFSNIKILSPNFFKENSLTRNITFNKQFVIVELNEYPIEIEYQLVNNYSDELLGFKVFFDGVNKPVVIRIK